MAKFIFLIFAVLCNFPAYAQDAADVSAKRLELATQMHEIWPIRTRMESAIDAVAEGFPENGRAEIKAAMRKAIKYDQLQEESIKAMATIFTEEELKAMIDFYGSEEGRSVSAKTGDYEAAIRPAMIQMIDKAVLDLRTGQAR